VARATTCPATSPAGPPSALEAASLFERPETMIECPKSTLLFGFFAQWFTDGFLRSARDTEKGVLRDTQRNESTHEIDLSQLYGLTQAATRQLRARPDELDAVTGRPCRGLLKNQNINGEEYPQFLLEQGKPRKEFERLLTPVGFARIAPTIKGRLFALGTDVTNVGALACNVLFLREHNRIARCLGDKNPRWDDARVFETTRNILTVMLLKIVVEDYVNHITPNRLEFRVAPDSFINEPWKRPNRMAIEFNLLYRWHSLVPSTFDLNGHEHHLTDTLWDTRLLTNAGLGQFMTAASSQPAGRIGLRNTDPFLVERAELPSIKQARAARLCSYNDYRRLCGLIPAAGFHEISSDPTTQEALYRRYGSVEAVEFYVGLFAEDLVPNSILPELMLTMVAFDAFSQALNNPLLAPRIHTEATFSRVGREIIDETASLSDIVQRNTPSSAEDYFVSFTRLDYRA
jgi:prostaglandin-endoperoxide synthase 2